MQGTGMAREKVEVSVHLTGNTVPDASGFHGDSPAISAEVLQADPYLWPGGFEREALAPFKYHDRRFCEQVFQSQSLEIVEAFDTV